MKKIDNYFVDEKNNKWNASFYTEEQAQKESLSLSDCSDCSDCRNCSGCSGCRNCRNCRNCSGCSGCRNCRNCSYCRGCSDCRNCSSCNGCSDCSGCRNCSGCSNFKENPERITSPILGSRSSQTTFYWTKDKEQVICGCFKGTLNEFEERVKNIHKENNHAKEYLAWIEKVRLYKNT